MKMRRVKLRVNRSQLLYLSKEKTSENFQKEGMLQVGRKETALAERFCRLRGNLLFILKKQGGELEEVLLLEKCNVMKLSGDGRRLAVSFESGDSTVFLQSSSSAESASWLVALRDANTETLRRRITHLHTLIDSHSQEHTNTTRDSSLENEGSTSGAQSAVEASPLHLAVECRGLVAMAATVQVQVCVTNAHTGRKYCSTQIVKTSEDGEFLTSVCFRGDSPTNHPNRIEVTVYRPEESMTHTTRSFMGFASFSVRDLLRSKEPHISLSLRAMDGVNDIGEVKVSRLQMEEDGGDKAPEHQCPALCDTLHSSVQDKENSPMMRAALCAHICKVYRFQTEDRRWLLVREQMSETPLSFSLPKQLLDMLIQEQTNRVLELKELGDLSPHWDGLRHDVINHCNHLIGCYEETLAELNKLSASSCFKSSSTKSDRHLQFVPTNLHSQRMEVTSPNSTGVWYEVITFGAPADHHHAFKHGGLKRLLSKHLHRRNSSVSYTRDESCRARELLASMAQLQPLIFGLAEELLSVSLELNAARLQEVLDNLKLQTELFVHALKDELVKNALLAIHDQVASRCNSSHVHSNGLLCETSSDGQDGLPSLRLQDHGRRHTEYDEDEWDMVWINVAKSLNCIIAMVDRLQGRERSLSKSSSPGESRGEATPLNTVSPSSFSASWQEQLLPLVVTLRDCVREAVTKARAAMTFVVLQGAVTATVAQGSAQMVQRRHAVFSQALPAVVCGFMLKLYGGLEDPDFLQQLPTVGILAQFEGLLSTYGDEVGMLEDMEVGVADLSRVAFTVTQARTEQPDDLLPTLSGAWGSFIVEVPLPLATFSSLPQELKDGCLIRVEPVLFNIGINQHQSLAERFGDSSLQERVNHQSCERLKAYCNTLRDTLPHMAGIQSLADLLSSLDRSVESRKRKNVELLWIAAMVCRKVNGVRLTSCKSAKDRTAMSVTLEQCAILRERHSLGQQHFSTALDCMRRDGCRMENVQKNVGSRKFAFSSVQLLTFPKLYRPPDGSYG
ncbi:type II inositol 3,4-bisphosphate 4-phosphatase-like isoform X3 [Melanotaenia boesemani]|uniref:type II inositol 3,4-bisphosphate 4-phosphatase-like isoform X2 n=1 Tax=Melanotaenia boesemani TaxID=1250792 RepID=UPI001C047DA3|nr:type II inositol 3,4-bisphosphate 4-phosphatase-like isoform X2 [Melanotaenia boesemani]XP_041841106.1 type II inositol 3,4-bisphosphate 4-phosphatase-like isoform X3 [Melanotaenia boesemani]